jgi:hypothetical protein
MDQASVADSGAGTHWLRSADGSLEEISQPAADYYGLAHVEALEARRLILGLLDPDDLEIEVPDHVPEEWTAKPPTDRGRFVQSRGMRGPVRSRQGGHGCGSWALLRF